jgi:hypothetical protein
MGAFPPLTPPAATHTLGTAPRAVRFRHPAYPSSAPDLLVLMATDGDGGLDFDIALTACCIVADTNWDDGYLAQTVAGNNVLQRVDRPQDGLLRGFEYFFCVKERDPLCIPCPCILLTLLRYVSLPDCFRSRCQSNIPHPIVPSLALPARQFRRKRRTARQPSAAVEAPTATRVCPATWDSEGASRGSGSRYHLPGVWLYGWC